MGGTSNAFDATTNQQVFTVTGTVFPEGDITAMALYLDGVKQETLSVSLTSATFAVTEALDETTDNLRVYFNDGLPFNFDSHTSATMVPTLVSISPSSGSSGGTLLTVTGTGFGVNTASVNLIHESTGDEICQTVTLLGYGSFSCLTKSMEISSGDSINLKTASGSYSCGNTLNSADCNYEQINSVSPTVSSVVLTSSTQIDVTGANFPTSGFEAVVIVLDVESDSAVINSDTSITATFTAGVPVSSVAFTPSLRFVPSTGGRRRLVALTDADEQQIAFQDSITIENTLTVTDSQSGLSCSFQGGCPYTVTASGLTATLKASETS